MKKIYILLLFVVLACGAFLMPFEKNKNADAALCGFDDDDVCRLHGSECYCLDPE
jgi:hypothetical protein